ncbi:MAG: HD domain-containing phosphohydrolase [Gemmatimonadales bacterium]
MPHAFPRQPRILVVDDEQINIDLVRRILEPTGYTDLASTTDPRRAVALCRALEPDLILLDLRMPQVDGLELLGRFAAEIPQDEYLPILVLTSDDSADAKRLALSGGARDFLTKPLSPTEVRLRVHNLLETRFLHLELREHNRLLETRVRDRTAELVRRTEELEEARVEILERLARAAEFRDDDTGYHTQRVGRLAAILAEASGQAADAVELIRRAAPLHDVGKIGVPDYVLLKQGRLDEKESLLMQRHTVIGGAILSGSGVPLLALGKDIALSHHERWDGTGYPSGARGTEIPMVGRLVAVADVFDALTHGRPYKSAWGVAPAVAEIVRERGRQFDPDVVDAFMTIERTALEALATDDRPAAVAR